MAPSGNDMADMYNKEYQNQPECFDDCESCLNRCPNYRDDETRYQDYLSNLTTMVIDVRETLGRLKLDIKRQESEIVLKSRLADVKNKIKGMEEG